MKEITTTEVEEMLNGNTQVHLIDVREVDEVQVEKIPGVIHIPLGLLEARMHELDKRMKYIVVCRSGGRSGRAVQFLNQFGYQAVNMVGGMLEWKGSVE